MGRAITRLTIIPTGLTPAGGVSVAIGSNTTLTVDDSADTMGGTDTVSATQIIAGPAAGQATINLIDAAPSQLNVYGGLGSPIQVTSTAGPTNITSAGSTAITLGTESDGTDDIADQLAIQVNSGTGNTLTINQTGSQAYDTNVGPAGTSTQTDQLTSTASNSIATYTWTALPGAAFANVTLESAETNNGVVGIYDTNWPLTVIDQLQRDADIAIYGTNAPVAVDGSSASGQNLQPVYLYGTINGPVSINAGVTPFDTLVYSVTADSSSAAITFTASPTNAGAELDLFGTVSVPITASGISTFDDNATTTASVTLEGSTGMNDFEFSGSGSSDVTIDTPSGSGPNTLDFSQLGFGTGVNVNLATGGTQTVATSSSDAALTLNLAGASIQQLDGTPFVDTLTGGSGSVTLNGEGGNDILNYGTGNTTFQFTGAPTGTATIQPANPGSSVGNNTLDFSGLAYATNINLNNTGLQTVYSNSYGTLSIDVTAADAINGVDGSAGSVLTGISAGTTFGAGAGNETFTATGGNSTFINLNNNETDIVTDTVNFPTSDYPRGVASAQALLPSGGQIYVGVPTIFELINPSVPSGQQAYYSFSTTPGGLATSYNGAGASISNLSQAYTFSSLNTSYTVWGRIFDGTTGQFTTYEEVFTATTPPSPPVNNNNFVLGGAASVAPGTSSSSFSYTVTLSNNNNTPLSQWVVYWGDGQVSDYDLTPTTTYPLTATHTYQTLVADADSARRIRSAKRHRQQQPAHPAIANHFQRHGELP